MKCFLLLLLAFVRYNTNAQVCTTDLAEVKYYEELIKKNIHKSLIYKSPTSADAFRPKSDQVTDFGQFDFIVVGSGAAGAVIASRLSEIQKWKVLLVEAGGDIDDFANIPAMGTYLTSSKYNWNFTTTQQTESCLGTSDRRCAVNRGKAFGGSTSINGLNYIRGNKDTFNNWERDGMRGWSYKNVLPYFIKSENCQIDGDPDYHGKGGYLAVGNVDGTNLQLETLMEASQNLFNYTSTDINGKCQLGLFVKQANQIRGQRQSIARAFLIPYEKRKNLFILRHAYATKVLIENKTTRGIEFALNGTLFQATITKEVILSAGGVQSPQLLMLSGIGPKEELQRLNISLIKDLPVGCNIPDQPSFAGLSILTNYTEPAQTLKSLLEEYIQYKGELTLYNNGHGMGFYQSSYVNASGLPDIRITFGQSNSLSEVLQNITNATVSGVNQRTSFAASLEILNPLSLGTVKLKSRDPYTYPLINPNYYSNTQDLEVMYQGVQIVQQLVETPEMQRLNASLHYQNNYPECEIYDETSKEYWFCAFRYSMSSTIFQGLGSCRMGCDSNTSVVNNKLKVHGIKRLRVADGGVIPSSISGIAATVIMIGEKISDDIKLYYNEPIKRIDNVFGYNN